jgi:hypothetical protein
MEFLELNQICEWAKEHGLDCGEDFALRLPELPSCGRRVYAAGGHSGRESAMADDLVKELGRWDECLVRITLWGVWPSSEDWPRFYAWRGSLGERRSLRIAPGHQFDRDETPTLTALITLVMENAWDADVLCSIAGRADLRRAAISHDEWYEVFDAPEGERPTRSG